MNESGLNVKCCRKCKIPFEYSNKDAFWDENGSGYSTKLAICPICGHVNILKYEEDLALNVNNDERYYR